MGATQLVMASEALSSVGCSPLGGYRVLPVYIELVRNLTSFNETLLRHCREPICQTMFGFGVEDLSGIGVAIGYVLSIAIGNLLPFLLLVLPRLPVGPRFRTTLQTITTAGFACFFESAVYFALTIQIATCAMISPRDFQLMRSSTGVYEVRSACLVSILCILPLLSAIPILSSATASPPSTPTRNCYRQCIFLLAVVASMHPTISQLDWYFSPSIIGDGKGPGGLTYVGDGEWQTLWDVCFHSGSEGGGAPPLSSSEFAALGAFHLMGSLVVFLYSGVTFLLLVLRTADARNGESDRKGMGRVGFMAGVGRLLENRWAEYLLLGVQFGLALPLLWGFWRLRGIERQLSETTTGHYTGNDWGFGQVVAIAMFVPVAAEMLFVWLEGRRDGSEDGNDSASGYENVGLASLRRDDGHFA